MIRLTDLPSNILNEILENLDQTSLTSLDYTCKTLHDLCCRRLYHSIYITDENFDFKVNKTSINLSKWCIIRNSLKLGGNLKIFERSLINNPVLISYIRRIASDDFHFILFKLKFWGKRFFNKINNLNYVFLSNIPKTQINSIYVELFSFYSNKALSLQELQLRNVDELVKLSFCGNLNNVQYISFHLIEESSASICNIKIDPKTKQNLRNLFCNLKGLKIYSPHNQGISFLLLLQKLFGKETLFLNLNEFQINHVHRRPQENEKLKLATISNLINLLNLEKLSIEVDCDNIYRTTLERYNFDIFRNTGYCTCLEHFFDDISHLFSISKYLKSLTIIKGGESILQNPFSMYYFKFHMASFLSTLKSIKHLTVDTKSVIFPIHNLMGNETFSNMVHLVKQLNTEILLKFNSMGLKTLRIIDFFESFQIWELATFNIDKNNLNYYCKCSHCEITKGELINFLEVNEKIQFYLDPASYNVFLSFYYDLISTLLSYLKTGSVSRWLIDSIIHNASFRTDPQTATMLSSISNKDMVFLQKPLDLHRLYRHHNYKNSIDYRSMEVLRTPKIEVPCSCNDNEFNKFVEFISHQLSANVLLYLSRDCDIYINTFNV